MKKKAAPAQVPTDTRTVALHQEIATQAYVLWNHYGQPAGRDVDIWLEAERQLLGVDPSVNQQAGGAVDAKDLAAAMTAKTIETPASRVAAQPAPPA
ncbi:MAG TPA: DUF2934 domain-containing protein [Lacunisphaera sp.]|nr:DUF2934 domain-containing protein [Lacunisphaera sp.]